MRLSVGICPRNERSGNRLKLQSGSHKNCASVGRELERSSRDGTREHNGVESDQKNCIHV